MNSRRRTPTLLRRYPGIAVLAATVAVVATVGVSALAATGVRPRTGTGTSIADGGVGVGGSTVQPPAGRPSTGRPTTDRQPAADGDLRTGPGAGRSGPEEGTRRCTLSAKLVPSCGTLWGVAPGAYTDLRPSEALRRFEAATRRPADILHGYHRGDEVFPTADEISVARDPARKRLLFLNWKVAWDTTWANVAAGGQDARIDRLAERIKRTFPEPMFLALHHEPENDVEERAGSGMTAGDYAAMFRHTVQRMRARGVANVVFVMVYMAYEPWCVQPWFGDLWPGDDVVDWIGFDPYLFARPGGYGHGDFTYLVNRTSDPSRWPGFYTWVTRTHGTKPLMIAEWGVYEYASDPAKKAWIFSTVAQQLGRFPAIRALVYFDSPNAPKGDTRPDSSGPALEAYRSLADGPHFSVNL